MPTTLQRHAAVCTLCFVVTTAVTTMCIVSLNPSGTTGRGASVKTYREAVGDASGVALGHGYMASYLHVDDYAASSAPVASAVAVGGASASAAASCKPTAGPGPPPPRGRPRPRPPDTPLDRLPPPLLPRPPLPPLPPSHHRSAGRLQAIRSHKCTAPSPFTATRVQEVQVTWMGTAQQVFLRLQCEQYCNAVVDVGG